MVRDETQTPQGFQTRPPYPHIPINSLSPVSSSAFQGSSSLNSTRSITSSNSESQPFNMPAQFSPHGYDAAPMPSPSAGFPGQSYFAPISPSQTSQSQPSHMATTQHYHGQPQQSQQPHHQSSQSYQTSNCSSQPPTAGVPRGYAGQQGNGQGAPVTAPFLQDFSLIAEAAKRAQMEVLARDLGDVGL